MKISWVISVIILYEQSCDEKIQFSCVLFLLYTNDFLRQTWLWILSRNNLVIQSCGTSQEYFKSCWENDNIVVTTVLWYFCYNLAKNIKVGLLRQKLSWEGVWQQSCDSYSNWNLAKNHEPPKSLRESVKNILRGVWDPLPPEDMKKVLTRPP